MLGLQQRLQQFGSARILAHVKEAANTALSRMKDRWAPAAAALQGCNHVLPTLMRMGQTEVARCRFSEVFMRDEHAMPRRWGPRDNITAVMHKAYRESAQLLAQLVAFRLGMPQVSAPAAAEHPNRLWQPCLLAELGMPLPATLQT